MHKMSNTNAHLQAAALAYDPLSDKAPRIVAKGAGVVAQKIIEKAKEHDLPVHEDKDLLSFLMRLNIDEQIPESLYVTVAHLLATLYQLESSGALQKKT